MSAKEKCKRWVQPTQERSMCVTTAKAIRAELIKPLECTPHHHLTWMDNKHRGTGFILCFVGLQYHFGPIPPFCVPIPPFWNGNVYSVLLYLGSMHHYFWFYRSSQLGFSLSLRGNFSFKPLNNTGIAEISGTGISILSVVHNIVL
jgi:hypothetical protein